MAVRALPGWRAGAQRQAVSVPGLVLGLALIAPALDLMTRVQPALALANAGIVASGASSLAVLIVWLRFPRASWLFAAAMAAGAGLAMRLLGADVAPVLSLLSVVALGMGGAFASREVSDVSLEAV